MKSMTEWKAAKGTMERIYSGALDAFSEYGYTDASMDRIAERAGVVKRTLYNHFQTKEELFQFVIQQGVDELTDLLREQLATEAPFADKWTGVVRSHLAFFEANRKFSRLLLQTMWSSMVPKQFTLQALMGDYFTLLDEAIRNDQKNGLVDENFDAEVVSSVLFGMFSIPALRLILHDEHLTDPKRIHTIVTLVMKGLSHHETLVP